MEAIPFADATIEVTTPVVPRVEIAPGPVKSEVPPPTKVDDEVDSDGEVQTEEAVVVVIIEGAT